MKALAPAVLLCTATAPQAATVGMWTGPGPRACNGQCPQAWAFEQAARAMPEAIHAALAAEMAANPEGSPAFVRDGQMLAMNTFAGPTGPVAEFGSALAALDEPELAWGWHVTDSDGVRWGFVQVYGCMNWQVLHGRTLTPTTPITPAAPVLFPPATTTLFPPGNPFVPLIPLFPFTPTTPDTPYEPPYEPPVVPLPAPVLPLLTAVLGLLLPKWIRA